MSLTKSVNATPLTPRVAGSTPSNLATPLFRRATRQDTTPNGPHRDERTTPVGSFLSSNITPRSGSRKSRLDSANSTPTGTPPPGSSATEPLRIPTESLVFGGGVGLPPLDSPSAKPTVSFSTATSDVGSVQERSQPQAQSSAKFFYASDAKPNIAQPLRQRPGVPKQNNFLYANGGVIPSSVDPSGLASVLSAAEDKARARFVHANGTPDTTTLPSHPIARAGSTVSNASYTIPPRLAFQNQTSTPRPLSPTRSTDNVTNHLPKSISALSSPIVSQFYTNAEPTTRADVEAHNILKRHAKSSSFGQLDLRSATESNGGSDISLRSIEDRTSISSGDDGSESTIADDNSTLSGLRSPVMAGSSLEQLNELAANARRERKVLDLEITNSSLAAINRTLEREMRKQSAELRRYRRLSRSGRLSIATETSRSSTGSLLAHDEADAGHLSDMSEEEYSEDDDNTSEPDSVDDGSLSPAALAESDARHRDLDEQRLQLDLTKHQQLLVDSQKMNQSLKRCLGWTEELISEGKKALAYQIHVSEVELGGRVLVTDENEDHEDEIALQIGPDPARSQVE